MEVKKRRHPLRNLSLKWSFILYMTVFVAVALVISLLLSGLFSRLQDNIYSYYAELYQDELQMQGDLILDGEVIEDFLQVYREDPLDKATEQELRLFDLYGVLAILCVPVVCVICLLLAGATFYKRKLKIPLALLDTASARISGGDLDFTVEYDCRNELGRLAHSFETMRASLYENNREMWRMMEGRRRLNAAFAHDLRTPLTVLRGYCDFLLKYVPDGKIDSEKALSTLSTMDVYLKRLEGYTTTMSSLQRLEELEISSKPTSFSDICGELENTAAVLAERKSLEFNADGDGQINIDMAAVSHVYENILTNAVRYAVDEIRISCSVKAGVFCICVCDDGSGFTVEGLKNAAAPYFRDEKDISDATHFGLGLYICRFLCEKHGGRLSIENDGGGKVTASFASLPNISQSI